MAPSGFVPTDPDVLAYFTAAEAAGATYVNGTKEALDTFVIGMKSASLWALVRRWNPMLADGGNVLAGVARVLNSTVGTANVDALNNYVSGDWNAASGLQGNGSTTFINTGWNATGAQMTSAFLGACYRGAALSAGKTLFGVQDGAASPTQIMLLRNNFSGLQGYCGDNKNATSGALTLNPALYAIARDNASSLTQYIDNVANGTNVVASTIVNTTQPVYVGAYNNGGAAAGVMSPGERSAGYIFLSTLDGTQRGNLQSLWAAFNAAVGR